MNSLLIIRISFRSLLRHKGRSLLTMLGISMGIATIIATLGIGKGIAKQQQEKIQSMGNNFIMVTAGNWMARGAVKSGIRKKQQLFSNEDISYLKNQCPEIAAISPCTTDKQIVSHNEHHLETDIRSGNEQLLSILDRTIKEGSFFTPDQVISGDFVVVLGDKAAQTLFPQGDALGNTVSILKKYYRVIGIANHIPNFWGAADPDFELYIPFKTAQKQLQEQIRTKFGIILISAASRDQMPYISSEINTLLRIRRNSSPEDFNDFIIHDSAAMEKAATESFGILNLFLLFIASISLLVAGVGVMNMQLISVTERTQEIGIRLALGATKKNILRQFLFEAIILCLSGGIIGIIVGIGAAHLITKVMLWKLIITPLSIITACSVTTGIGIFFGYYPAQKAAELDPVTALAER